MSATLPVELDRESSEPLYRQIESFVRAAIDAGRLRPGQRIPSVRENAAVAFHYEEPKARAPQSLLLAVCPDSRETWDDDLISGILQETLELAKIRTVDLDSVLQVGQILPALYFPFNLQGATVSTHFVGIKGVGLAAQFVR